MNSFLIAFAQIIQQPIPEAFEQWAAFSRQLSDSERKRIERGGTKAGKREGHAFNRMFPPQTQP